MLCRNETFYFYSYTLPIKASVIFSLAMIIFDWFIHDIFEINSIYNIITIETEFKDWNRIENRI